ncbi:MAG: hypothetical protein EOP62_21020 [Sphingomonadales bacterium]|nr:MAG: hypothetical protein EOP62_21020 [Sphingomonadales bacterium]
MLHAVSHALAMMLTMQPVAVTACPATTAEAKSRLAELATAHKLAPEAVTAGKYGPVSVSVLGVKATRVSAETSGDAFGGVPYLAAVDFSIPGTFADISALFLAAYPTTALFKSNCTQTMCTYTLANPADRQVGRFDAIVPRGALHVVSLYSDHRAPGKVVLSCMYRAQR